MKRNFLTILTIVLILAGLVLISRLISNKGGQITSASTDGILTATETSFDFGEVSMLDGRVSHIFKIKNAGTETLTVNGIYTSCMCTEAVLITDDFRSKAFGMPGHGRMPEIREEISPGEEAEVEVVFDPAAHGPAGLGKTQREIYLENSGKGELRLDIIATVIP